MQSYHQETILNNKNEKKNKKSITFVISSITIQECLNKKNTIDDEAAKEEARLDVYPSSIHPNHPF